MYLLKSILSSVPLRSMSFGSSLTSTLVSSPSYVPLKCKTFHSFCLFTTACLTWPELQSFSWHHRTYFTSTPSSNSPGPVPGGPIVRHRRRLGRPQEMGEWIRRGSGVTYVLVPVKVEVLITVAFGLWLEPTRNNDKGITSDVWSLKVRSTGSVN